MGIGHSTPSDGERCASLRRTTVVKIGRAVRVSLLRKKIPKSSVESDLRLSVYELHKLETKFDIILCLGVFYHLLDPFYAFSQIRHRCHEHSLVVFEGDAFFGLIETPDQSPALYARDVRKAPRFVPGPDTLRLFIDAAYFKILANRFFLCRNRRARVCRLEVLTECC